MWASSRKFAFYSIKEEGGRRQSWRESQTQFGSCPCRVPQMGIRGDDRIPLSVHSCLCSTTGPVWGASWSTAPAQTGLGGIHGMCVMGNAWATDLAQPPRTHLSTGHWPEHLSCTTSAPAADIYIDISISIKGPFPEPLCSCCCGKAPSRRTLKSFTALEMACLPTKGGKNISEVGAWAALISQLSAHCFSVCEIMS